MGIRIIKIAAADNVLIALTNGGHVLKHDHLMHQTDLAQGRWEYVRTMLHIPCISLRIPPQMPNFSEVDIVREHKVFKKAKDDPNFVKPPQSMRITHVSVNVFTPFTKVSIKQSDICSLPILRGLLHWSILDRVDGQCGLHFSVTAIYQIRAPESRHHFRRAWRLSQRCFNIYWQALDLGLLLPGRTRIRQPLRSGRRCTRWICGRTHSNCSARGEKTVGTTASRGPERGQIWSRRDFRHTSCCCRVAHGCIGDWARCEYYGLMWCGISC